MNEMTRNEEKLVVSIEPFKDSDRDSILAGITDLQDVERGISDTRLPGAEVAEKYFQYLQTELAEKRGTLLVARHEGKVAGFASCMIEQDDTPAETPESTTYGYISDAYVAPAYRGRGVFGELNQSAEEYLSGFPDVKIIRLTVLAGNESAVKAYEKSGYKPEEIILSKKVNRAN